MSYPMVSALCPTFGRAALQPELLNAAVHAFVAQDYKGPKELIILSDAPGQELHCELEGVQIRYAPRIRSLGVKCNLLCELARGTIGVMWEDDDCSLPHRMSQAVEMLGDKYDYWTPRRWWFHRKGQIPVCDGNGYGHNCSAFRIEALKGKYEDVTIGHDARINGYALSHLRCREETLHCRDVSYIYRWGFSRLHLSAYPEGAYAKADAGPPGIYHVRAIPDHDYPTLIRQALGEK